MLYLLSRPVNISKARQPLQSETKQRLVETGEDLKVAYVREYLEKLQSEINDGDSRVIKLTEMAKEISETYRTSHHLTSRHIRPIVESFGHKVICSGNQMAIRIKQAGQMGQAGQDCQDGRFGSASKDDQDKDSKATKTTKATKTEEVEETIIPEETQPDNDLKFIPIFDDDDDREGVSAVGG